MQKISIKSAKNILDIRGVRKTISIDANHRSFTVKSKQKHNISMSSSAQKLYIKQIKQRFSIDTIRRSIIIQTSGKRGLPGPKGADGKDGLGVPAGGLPGQVLVKLGTEDNDTGWGAISGSDKYYVQNFIASSLISVNHNLFKYPAVTVHDSAGDEVEGEVDHLSINSLEVRFSAPFSGTVTCN